MDRRTNTKTNGLKVERRNTKLEQVKSRTRSVSFTHADMA